MNSVNLGLDIDLLDDHEHNINDIKLDTEEHFPKIKIHSDLKPSTGQIDFEEILFQRLIKNVDGHLIDVDLQKFKLKDLILNINEDVINFSNGTHIAKYLHQFNKQVHISVISAYLDDPFYQDDIKSLPQNINKYKKSVDDKDFVDILTIYYEDVKTLKIKKRIFIPSYNDFKNSGIDNKLNYLRKSSTEINSNLYFNVVGDYSWFLQTENIEKKINGPALSSLNKKKLKLKEKYKIDVKDKDYLNSSQFQKIVAQSNYIPNLFWNVRNVKNLKANLQLLSPEANDIYKFTLNLQAAYAIAKYYSNFNYYKKETKSSFQLNKNGTKKLLSKLDLIGQLEFQINLFDLNKNNISSMEEANSLISPFSSTLNIHIVNIFHCRVDLVEKDIDVAWVSLENKFDNEKSVKEPFKYSLLVNYDILTRGTYFHYIIYNTDYNSDLTVKLMPIHYPPI